MLNGYSFEDFYAIFKRPYKKLFPELQMSRKELIDFASKKKTFDLVIAGGGIHGASFAWLSALNGLKVLLLEQEDYGTESVKRGLDNFAFPAGLIDPFSFKTAYEEHRATKMLTEIAPHLVKPVPCSLPVFEGEVCRSLRLRMTAATQKVLRGFKKVTGQSSLAISKEQQGVVVQGQVVFAPRIIQELILAARQEGALCLNHAKVEVVVPDIEHGVSVRWTDCLSEEHYETLSAVLINCTGCSVPKTGRIHPSNLSSSINSVEEITLISSIEWPDEIILLPFSNDGFCCIGPAPEGMQTVFVGSGLAGDIKLEAKKDLCLRFLREQVPALDRLSENLIAVLEGQKATLSDPIRRNSFGYSWVYNHGILNLLGGRACTALREATVGLKELAFISSFNNRIYGGEGRVLPGAWKLKEGLPQIQSECASKGLSDEIVNNLLKRRSSLAKLCLDGEHALEIFNDHFIQGEVDFARDFEQAETEEDLLRRLCVRR